MKKRHRIAAIVGLALVITVMSGAAYATHGGLHGLFNSRGTIEPFTIKSSDMRLKIRAKEPIDVAIVGAQLDPSGQTGWHIHPENSIVTVQPGGPALRVYDLYRGRCRTRTFGPGEGFVHPAGPHNFVNLGATPLNFGVAYFVPIGATLLTNVPPPGACS